MDASKPVEVQIDYGNISGLFVRLDLAVYPWDSGGPAVPGWVGLTTEEAESLAAQLLAAVQDIRERD